jgi:hypothetical protein
MAVEQADNPYELGGTNPLVLLDRLSRRVHR